MSGSGFSRRTFLQGSVGLTVANFVPGTTPFAHAATMEEHLVVAGDSYWRIAEHYTGSGSRWRELRDLNVGRLHANGTSFATDSKLIHPGDHLLLPVAWSGATTPTTAWWKTTKPTDSAKGSQSR